MSICCRFCEEDIDQILERRTKVVQLETEEAGSTFAKARFVAEGTAEDLDINDPAFWQKWAEKAQLDLDQLANKVGLSALHFCFNWLVFKYLIPHFCRIKK